MPFKSKAQNAWAHTSEGEEKLGGKEAVKEWESETNYSTLPDKVSSPDSGRKKKFSFAGPREKKKAGYTQSERLA